MEHTDAWSFYESLGQDDRAALSKVAADVAAICDLRQEVNSGGFDSYLRCWGGDTAPRALAVLPGVLGQDWADVLGTAMSLLGSEYPPDADTRHDRLVALGLDEDLDALDAQFYELEASSDADTLVSSYLRQMT